MCSTLHVFMNTIFHHSININETWQSEIQMMGLELGNPVTSKLAQTLILSWTSVAKLCRELLNLEVDHRPIRLLVYYSDYLGFVKLSRTCDNTQVTLLFF